MNWDRCTCPYPAAPHRGSLGALLGPCGGLPASPTGSKMKICAVDLPCGPLCDRPGNPSRDPPWSHEVLTPFHDHVLCSSLHRRLSPLCSHFPFPPPPPMSSHSLSPPPPLSSILHLIPLTLAAYTPSCHLPHSLALLSIPHPRSDLDAATHPHELRTRACFQAGGCECRHTL